MAAQSWKRGFQIFTLHFPLFNFLFALYYYSRSHCSGLSHVPCPMLAAFGEAGVPLPRLAASQDASMFGERLPLANESSCVFTLTLMVTFP